MESPFVSTGGPLAVLADGSAQPPEPDPAQLAMAFRPVRQHVTCICMLNSVPSSSTHEASETSCRMAESYSKGRKWRRS